MSINIVNDYVKLNNTFTEEMLDANYFQHTPYRQIQQRT